MSALKGLRATIRSVFHPRDAEQRMEEEFHFHVDMETQRLIAAGQTADEAKRIAMMTFGGADRHREAMRDGRGARWFDDMWADLRYAFRQTRRSPGFAIAIALTVGIGVGVNGITFGFVNSLLLRPMPARNADELVGVYTINSRTRTPGLLMYEDYLDLRDRSGVFQDVAGRTDGPLNLAVPATAGNSATSEAPVADMVWGEFVTENYFTLLGTTPALGRFFNTTDGPQGANAVAVVSYDAWSSRFNREASIVGRVVRINGTNFTITGVAPKGFRGVRTFGFWPDLWVPIGMHNVLQPGSQQMLQGRGDGWMMVIARMKKGWNRPRTSQALTTFATQLATNFPATNRDLGLMLIPSASGNDHPAFVKPRVLQLASALGMFAAFVTLLIICANLANLQLARAKARTREIGIRLSLGCSRARLVRQLLLESIVVAIPGALIATAVLYASPLLESLAVPRLQFRVGFNPSVDRTVLAYTGMTALVAVTLFGLVPALRASRTDIAPSLSAVIGNGRRGTRKGTGMRTSLVVGQLALSVMLLVAGTLFVRSLVVARAADVGFATDNRVMMTANPGLQGYDRARGLQFYRDVLARLENIPGVVSASWAFPVPFDTYGRSAAIYVPGYNEGTASQPLNIPVTHADIDFDDAMGLTLVRGRTFDVTDSSGAPRVMVVSQQLAARFWPGQDAIGQRARLNDSTGAEITVVGVVRDAKFSIIGEQNQQHAYLPLRQNYRSSQTLVVHSTSNNPQLTRDIRAAIASIDPTLPMYGMTTMRDAVASGFATNQTAAAVGTFFGLVSMLIAAIGLYAVVATSVIDRTREIGVRMALGATAGGIVRLVMHGGARMAVAGITIGLLLAVAVARSMRGLLYGVSGNDPFTFVTVPIVLLAVVAVATAVPALRAVRMSPTLALRGD